MSKTNCDLRLLCKGNNIPLWMIAERMGISDQTLYRRWRKELPTEEKVQVQKLINEIMAEIESKK